MDEALKNALITGIVGFVVMLIASVLLWVAHLSELLCTVIMVIGLLIVIFALIYASKPEFAEGILKKIGIIKD